jgi:hypothetical protein
MYSHPPRVEKKAVAAVDNKIMNGGERVVEMGALKIFTCARVYD